MIAEKRGEKYADVMNFVRTKLRFSLLRSVLIAVRGVRGRCIKEPYLGNISFNLVPRFELLKTTVIALRGDRGHKMRTDFSEVQDLDLNLEPFG